MAIGLKLLCHAFVSSTIMVLGFACGVNAIEVPPRPTDIPVVDQTNTLTPEQKTVLANKIAAQRTETGNQIAILMVSTLDDQPIENYTLDVARTWGVGSGERNNGVLLLIAKDDRQLRIEVGTGLEGALTDIRSGQIIRERITPEFRDNNYFAGIDAGLDSIITAINGEIDPNLGNETAAGLSRIPWEFIFGALFFIPTWLSAILARTKSWWAGGVIGAIIGIILGFIFGFLFIGVIGIVILTIVGLFFDRAVSRNFQQHVRDGDTPSWWAGGAMLGGGGGGNSGGFGGFGGGDFGGGGSSGSW